MLTRIWLASTRELWAQQEEHITRLHVLHHLQQDVRTKLKQRHRASARRLGVGLSSLPSLGK
jgi:hypothetical protein